MYNEGLAGDYLKRAASRLKALDILMAEESWADVVREAQEIVEITLKALLRFCRIEVPSIHDVSPVLEQNDELLPGLIREQLDELTRISRSLRRDRELAFYGSEDLTPSEFYTREDAATALAQAHLVHKAVSTAVGKDNRS
jgi:HEPN domain-containing protein